MKPEAAKIEESLTVADEAREQAAAQLSDCPTLPNEARECLSKLVDSHQALTAAVRHLVGEFGAENGTNEIGDIASKYAGIFLKNNPKIADRRGLERVALERLITEIAELGADGHEFGLHEIRKLARREGVISSRQVSMSDFLESFREYGLIETEGEPHEKRYRLGEKLR